MVVNDRGAIAGETIRLPLLQHSVGDVDAAWNGSASAIIIPGRLSWPTGDSEGGESGRKTEE
jgi:hypothetical protein